MFNQNIIPYRPIRTDKDPYFQEFLEFGKNDIHHNLVKEKDYVIQLVESPNFSDDKTIKYFKKVDNKFEEISEKLILENYKKANSYKNFKTNRGVGHPKGLFYEFNLYTRQQKYSPHHISTVKGNSFHRDNSHDSEHIENKGPHW